MAKMQAGLTPKPKMTATKTGYNGPSVSKNGALYADSTARNTKTPTNPNSPKGRAAVSKLPAAQQKKVAGYKGK